MRQTGTATSARNATSSSTVVSGAAPVRRGSIVPRNPKAMAMRNPWVIVSAW